MKVKGTIEYVGEAFHGFQEQGELPTVQSEVEKALAVVLSSWSKKAGRGSGAAPKIIGSGRTDAGVHARGQVISFDWPDRFGELHRLCAALNGITSPALTVLQLEEAPPEFDARRSPHRKLYSYRMALGRNSGGLEKNRAWHIGSRIDVSAMIECARQFVGQHNFSAFRASDCTAKSTVRTILASEITRIDRRTLLYTIEGKGFLKQMVRIIAGTLVQSGRGELLPIEVADLIRGGRRRDAGTTAPACGLVLERVSYLESEYFEKKAD